MLHGSCSSSLGQTQCLERLAAHETAWHTLSWTGSASVDALICWGEPVSVSGNVLCFLANSGISHQELLLLRAPSKLRNVVEKAWKIQFPCDIQDVCGDSFAVACEKGLHISVWNWKSGEHTLDFVRYVIQMKWYPVHADCESKMALLQTPVFTFLDEYHILLPGWTGDSIYVYDIRAVSPINKKQTLN